MSNSIQKDISDYLRKDGWKIRKKIKNDGTIIMNYYKAIPTIADRDIKINDIIERVYKYDIIEKIP